MALVAISFVMNPSRQADVAQTHLVQENSYPSSSNTNDSECSSGLHRRSHNAVSPTSQCFTQSTFKSDGHRIPLYTRPCFSIGLEDVGRSGVKIKFASILVLLVFLFLFLLPPDNLGRGVTKIHSNISSLSRQKSDTKARVKNLAFQRENYNVRPQTQREVLVRNPDITLHIRGKDVEAGRQCPRGILFLFHGCGRHAASFYYSPQGRRIISTANEAGMVTVAVEKDFEMGCWNSFKDFEVVHSIAKTFLLSRIKSCVSKDGGRVYPPLFGF